MAGLSLIAATLLAQTAAPVLTVEADLDRLNRVDVGYTELMEGRPKAAIERIEANRDIAPDDPAAHINLAAAHARLGHMDIAKRHYLAAIASRTVYEVELADGRWMDTRRAARLGAEGLAKGKVLALR